MTVPPLIKWTGSKSMVMPELAGWLPGRYNYFYDPFMGGGSTIPYSPRVIASDIFDIPILIMQAVKDNAEKVISDYQGRWHKFQEEPDYYYQVRDEFNETRDPIAFLFLTRTCYNGVIRFNSNGDFNVSHHLNRPGIHPSSMWGIVEMWHRFLYATELSVGDYRERLEKASEGDFVFLDPPYRGTKGQYHREAEYFDYDALINTLDNLSSRGAMWMLTLGGSDDNQIPDKLYTERLHTTPKSSSLRRLKGNGAYARDEVYLNYDRSQVCV